MDKKTIKERLDASFNTKSQLKCPSPTGCTPRGFQNAGVEYMLSSPGRRYLLADPMGVGKTIQAILYANLMRIKNILIVCPASIQKKWEIEIKKWHIHKNLSVQICRKDIESGCDVHIVSYNMVSKFQKDFPRKTLLILDECHALRHVSAARTKLIYGRGSELLKIPHIIAISGTAAMNRPLELFETIKALNWRAIAGMDRLTYGFRFCGGFRDPITGTYDFNGASNLDELGQRLRAYMMVRRNKNEILKDLPEKSTEILRLNENGSVEKFKMELKTVRKSNFETGLDHIATLRRLQGEYKVKLALPIIEEFLREEEKLVIFAHHKSVIQELVKHFSSYRPAVLVGDTPVMQRQNVIDSFQKGDKRLFIGSITAAGVGIELTAASVAIFIESMWTPAENDQAADRLHRIGQRNNVRIIFLTIKHDLDEYMLKRTLEKQKNIDKINMEGNNAKNEIKEFE